MAIILGNALAELKRRIRRIFRTRRLRAYYVANLNASAGSLENRVRFHIDHLDEYWDRCLGLLPVLQANTASCLSNDVVACIVVATESATRDVHAYCSQRATQPLSDAWDAYVPSLAEVRRGILKGAGGANQCASMFIKVRELHKTLLLQTPTDNTAKTA
jgi:hypothetical protein